MEKAAMSERNNGLSAYVEKVRAGFVRRSRSQTALKLFEQAAPKAKRSVTQALIEERGEGR